MRKLEIGEKVNIWWGHESSKCVATITQTDCRPPKGRKYWEYYMADIEGGCFDGKNLLIIDDMIYE